MAVAVQESTGQKLRALLSRQGTVLPVLGAFDAYTAKILEAAGAEAAFVGTGTTGGNYTGLPDLGLLSSTECIQFAGYIARAVSFPVMIDGDTGHGGPPAVRRFVHESIRAGLAGVRIDDQPIESKRGTQSAGIQIVPREDAVVRYKAAVEARNELDPDFVILAQCYARDAVNGGLDECLERLRIYGEEAGVDWVQFESPHDVEEIVRARAMVKGTLSAMQGKMPRPLTLPECADLGLNAVWYTGWMYRVLRATAWEFAQDFSARGLQAWFDFEEAHKDNPFLTSRGSQVFKTGYRSA